MAFGVILGLVLSTVKIDNKEATKDVECLATAIYYEARGEKKDGKIAVGNVVINRSKSRRFPNRICKVINQKGQFLWPSRRQRYDNSSLDIAKKLLYNKIPDNTLGATFFHRKGLSPKWKNLTKTKAIGKHVFYRF